MPPKSKSGLADLFSRTEHVARAHAAYGNGDAPKASGEVEPAQPVPEPASAEQAAPAQAVPAPTVMAHDVPSQPIATQHGMAHDDTSPAGAAQSEPAETEPAQVAPKPAAGRGGRGAAKVKPEQALKELEGKPLPEGMSLVGKRVRIVTYLEPDQAVEVIAIKEALEDRSASWVAGKLIAYGLEEWKRRNPAG